MISTRLVLNRQGLFIQEGDDLQGVTKSCGIMNNMEKLNREQEFNLSCNTANKGPQLRGAWGNSSAVERAYFSSSHNVTPISLPWDIVSTKLLRKVKKHLIITEGRGIICQRLFRLKSIAGCNV